MDDKENDHTHISESSRSPATAASETHISTRNTSTDMAAYDALSERHSTVDDHLGYGRSGYILEDYEAPISPTPVSLEDYVKHKPAGRNRGSKGWKPFDLFHGDFVPGLSQPSETTRLPTLLQDKASSKDPVPVGQVGKSQPLNLMQNQTGLHGSVIFDYPPNVTDADGSFRYASHSNGDVSVFQWSLPDLVWTHLGRIDNKDASSFQSFFNQLYQQTRYHLPNGNVDHKKIQINTSIKIGSFFKLCKKDSRFSGEDRAKTPLSSRIASYQREHSAQTPSAIATSDLLHSSQAAPALARASRNTTPRSRAHADPFSQLPRRSLRQGMLTHMCNDDPFVTTRERDLDPYHQPQWHHQPSEVAHQDWEDQEQRRLQRLYELRQQELREFASRTQDSIAQAARKSGSAYLTSGTLSGFRGQQGEQDLHRTVLHDPYQANVTQQVGERLHQFGGRNQRASYQPRTADRNKPSTASGYNASAKGLLRASEKESGSSERGFDIYVQPHEKQSLTDDELRKANPLIPSSTNGPYFASDAKAATASGGIMPLPHREEDVETWWSSANKITMARLNEYCNREIAIAGKSSDKAAVTATHLFVRLYESLNSYNRSQTYTQVPDYFARFTAPPAWCVDRSVGVGMGIGLGAGERVKTMFGEKEWATAPQRVGRDPRYRPLSGDRPGQHRSSLSMGIGMGRFG